MNSLEEKKGKSKEEIALAYRSEPWWYDIRGFFILTFAYNSTLSNQLRFFGPNFGMRHLEVACGTGTLLSMILAWRRRRGLLEPEIVGIDYAESMLAGARHRFRKSSNLEFLHADAAALPLEPNSFDTANIANSIHCFPDVDAALRGVCAVLKPGGRLAANVLLFPRGSFLLKKIANMINNWGMRKGILYTPYDVSDITERVTSAGFRIEQKSIHGNCLNILAIKVD